MLAVSMPPDLVTLPAFMSGTSEHNSDPVSNPTKQKPKLSLQTNALSTAFGGLTKGLSNTVSTLATTTPTTNNTYANTWDLTFRPSPVSRTNSPRPFPPAQTDSPEQPYTILLPFGVKPILKNSPLPADARRGSVTASPRESRRRVLFPQAKKVTFKRHLEDVIKNVEYIAKHSDLNSSSDSESIASDDSSGDSFQDNNQPISDNIHPASPPPAKRRRRRRNSGAVPLTNTGSPSEENEDDEDSVVEINVTPRADRKRRRWEWTLAPIRNNTPITGAGPYKDETGTMRKVHEPTKVCENADQGSTRAGDEDYYRLPRFGAKVKEAHSAPEIEDSSNKKSLATLKEIASNHHPKDGPRNSGKKEDQGNGKESTKTAGIDDPERDGG